MGGLWPIHVALIGGSFHDKYAIARIAFNILFALVVLYAHHGQPRFTSFTHTYDGIRLGTYVLLAFVQIPCRLDIFSPILLTNL